ncbi:MAG: hypothetical protein A2X64_10535 [Ignavibacteria bacterium GWF2_33_9]|nr:MAG: hypothetical protein A2X64_10535 [Ignavibacteria bacterium GWF2_33_9]
MNNSLRYIVRKVKIFSEIALGLTVGFSIISLITTIGFYVSKETLHVLSTGTNIVMLIFIFQELARFYFAPKKQIHLIERWFEILVSFLFIFLLFDITFFQNIVSYFFKRLSTTELQSINLTILNIILIGTFFIKSTKYLDSLLKLNLHPSALFALSFATIIFTGSIFLSLPKATIAGASTSYLDALFTSTSAVCVTGLVVNNTATHFTLFGQIIILLLIQIGGLGVMTLTTFFAAIVSGGLSVRVRFLMKEFFSQLNAGTIAKLIWRIFFFTLTIELIGAVILYISSDPVNYNGMGDLAFQSIFHSVSAFCNAGFSILQNGMMEKFVLNNPIYTLNIMVLIVLGGLGFTVLWDLSSYLRRDTHKNLKKFSRTHLSASSKLVLITSAVLIFGGGIIIFLLFQFQGFTKGSFFFNLYHSLFLSVTSRTAGFNTLASEGLSFSIAFFVIFLMWIGASPGSTGGGIKTTTFSLIFLSLFNTIRGKERLEIFNREISPKNINNAFQVLLANIGALSIGILVLLIIENNMQPLDLVFEAVSAASTVGLSRNVTPYLQSGSKIVIILLMFIGRVGFLNFFLAFYKPSKEPEYHYKTDTIMVG